jgi:Rap1a immunity proteins
MKLLLLALLLVVAFPAFGQKELRGPAMDGETLHKRLTDFEAGSSKRVSGENQFLAFSGTGYVEGVTDGYNGDLFCVPYGVTTDELLAVVLKYLNDNPTSWHKSAIVDIGVALREAYPCPAKPAG